jgi:hypothetical protein
MRFRFTLRDLFCLIAGSAVGILVTPPAVDIAIASGGGGHGHYVAARLLFPFTMLLSEIVGSVVLPLQILGVVQFPVYGAIVGFNCGRLKRALLIACVIAAMHVLAVAVCFSGFVTNFS